MPLLIALQLGVPFPVGAQGPDLPEPEKAFRISTRALDEHNVEVHFRIRVPVAARDAARGSVRLKVMSQGCADVGVCYVPLEQFIEVRLPGRSLQSPAAVDDITVHIFPWAVVKPESVRQAKSVWCSKDRVKAWNDLMLKRIELTAPIDCENPIQAQINADRRG